jgi:hypothetical protein
MSNITTTQNAKFIPTLIAQKALGRFASYMNLGKTVSRNFDTKPATEGQVLKLPKRGTVSANAKAQGSNVTVQNPTATDVSVTLDQHYEVTIGIEDVAAVLSNQNVLIGYAEDAAIALAEKIEDALSNLYASIPVGQVASFNESSDATKEASFYEVRERMAILKVPKLEQKFGYFHPTLISKLLRLDKFSRADALGGVTGAMVEGKLGRLGGIDIFESQMVIGTGSPAQYHNLVYTRNAFTLASRPLPSIGNQMGVVQQVINDPNVDMGLRVTSSYDPNALGMQVTLDVLFGVAINDDRCVVELRSA